MLTVLQTLADKELASLHFACDLGSCNGGCCTMPGGRGAPVLDSETDAVNAAIAPAREYLSDRSRQILEEEGGLEGPIGDRTTRCIDDRDCVFVYYEGEVAKCSIEKAWSEGRSDFRKPLSCHLFPIRIDELFGAPHLRYEKLARCNPALIRGEEVGVRLFEFLEEPITRAFGEEYYRDLVSRCRAWIDSNENSTAEE